MGTFHSNWPERLGFIVVLVVYLSTMAPGLVSVDSGELAAVVTRLGLAHPPGYPVYTVLGYLWVNLLGFLPPITAMNLFSVLALSLSVGVLISFTKDLIQSQFEIDTFTSGGIAIVSVLTLAFSSTFWMQAVGNEVYALHVLLCVLLLKYGVSYFNSGLRKHIIIGALLLGLGISHHLSIVVFIPGSLWILWNKNFFDPNTWSRNLILIIPVVFLPLTAYSWMFYNAFESGPQQWNVLDSFGKLLHHISAQQYTVFIVDTMSDSLGNLAFYFTDIITELTLGGVALGALGIYHLSKSSWILTIWLLSVYALNIVMSSFYDIPDISPYFLVAQIVVSVFIAIGLSNLSKAVGLKLWLLFLCLPLYILVTNYRLHDHSEFKAVDENFDQVVATLPESSLYLTNEFGLDMSPALYKQDIQSIRSDVIVLDLVSFVSNPGYHYRLRSFHPDFCDQFDEDLTAYTQTLTTWVYQLGISQSAVAESSKDLLLKMIESSISENRVFISQWAYGRYLRPGGPIDILGQYSLVPNGLVYEVIMSKDYKRQDIFQPLPIGNPEWDDGYIEFHKEIEEGNYSFLNKPKSILDELRFRQARMMDHRIQYELKYDSLDNARLIKAQLDSVYPKYKLPLQIIEAL